MTIPYVNFGGTQILQPPYVMEAVQLYGFIIPADLAALQMILDNRFNTPSGGTEHFEPAGPFVIFSFNKLAKIYSQNPPDSKKGWFAEQECAIWVRVVDRKRERSLWFNPYIFVDNSYAMAAGREVYGFPKAFGWFEIPEDVKTAKSLSLQTLVLQKFSPTTPGTRMTLIQAKEIAPTNNEPKIFQTAWEFLEELAGVLDKQKGLGKLEVVLEAVDDLVHRKEPMAFLKQFPASDTPGTACYQAIVESTAKATALHGACLLPGSWEIEITAADSHPIAKDLGLAGNTIPAALPLWLNFDMTLGLGTNVWTALNQPTPPGPRKTVAILGGGVGSMAAAIELTSEPDWQNRYDITVYQMGWRLGGKGASGRGENCRIEEHGLHIWMGFYENAFRMIRRVYEENKASQPPASPLRDWNEAFKPHNFIAITDSDPSTEGSPWEVWPYQFPEMPGTPGDGISQTIWDVVRRVIDILEDAHNKRVPVDTSGAIPPIRQAKSFAHSLDNDPRKHTADQHVQLVQQLQQARSGMRQAPPAKVSALSWKQLREIIDLGGTLLIGIIEDGCLTKGFDIPKLEVDLQDWLKKHGATPVACDVNQSALLRALYDLVFAYIDGDVRQPAFEAGVGVRCILLIVAAYKGAIFWKMQAGMGDVVFGPIYEVLKNRGVKFEFFHRVSNLELNPEGSAIAAIHLDVQATPVDSQKGYLPLESCAGLACCWPAHPLYEQLQQGNELRAGQYDLESFWTTWKNPAVKVLENGKDFDLIVLGISVGALPYLFSDPEKLPQPFQLMMKNVKTVQTQAVQLWVNCGLKDLGWQQGSVVLDAFENPLNTWAVMDQLLPRENWPPGTVAGIHYFCGPMVGGIPKRSEKDAPAKALQSVSAAARGLVQKNLPVLWPNMNDGRFKIVSQFLRPNIDPSERYVLSVPGSTKFRLKANESGLSNVVLAGDWTKNGFNAGCVEAAVMSGIQAANAIQGRPLNYGIDGPLELPR